MSKAKFIEEMMNFLPEDLTASQIKAVTQFCSNLFDKSSLVDIPNRLSKANERVRDLESKLEAATQEARIQACELDTQKGIVQSVQDKFNLRVYDFNISKALDIALNKFAIEKKVEALDWLRSNTSTDMHMAIAMNLYEEQLRKE